MDGQGPPVYVLRMASEPTTDELRGAVVDRAVAITHAAVTTELEMAPANLNMFLHGSQPQAGTLARLRAWYARHYGGGTAFAPFADAFGRLDSGRCAEIRAELERRIVQTSRRSVARAVRMSSDGLQKFLDGPCPATLPWRSFFVGVRAYRPKRLRCIVRELLLRNLRTRLVPYALSTVEGDYDQGSPHPSLNECAQSSAPQRPGRTGRMICYRLQVLLAQEPPEPGSGGSGHLGVTAPSVVAGCRARVRTSYL